MAQAFEERLELQLALLAKVEQCRRLASRINDPVAKQRLLDLADEYLRQIESPVD